MGEFRFQSVCCGEHYTVAGTSENDLLFWGTRCKRPTRSDDLSSSRSDGHIDSVSASSSRSHSRQASTTSINSISSGKDVQQQSTGKDCLLTGVFCSFHYLLEIKF